MARGLLIDRKGAIGSHPRRGVVLPGDCCCEDPVPCFCPDGETSLPQCCCSGGCQNGEDCTGPCQPDPPECRCFNGLLRPLDCCNPSSPIYGQTGPGQACDCGTCCRFGNRCVCETTGSSMSGNFSASLDEFICCTQIPAVRPYKRFSGCNVSDTESISGLCSRPSCGALSLCQGQEFACSGAQAPPTSSGISFNASFEGLGVRVNAFMTGVSLGSFLLPGCSGGGFGGVGTTTVSAGACGSYTSHVLTGGGSIQVTGCQPCQATQSQLAFQRAARDRTIVRAVRNLASLRNVSVEAAAASIGAQGGCSSCGDAGKGGLLI